VRTIGGVGGEMPGLAGVADAAVIERSLREPEAFAMIFDRHFGMVHGYLARRVGSGPADDLASSTFALAFESRHRFRLEATTARPWLLGIATNLVRNERRAERRALAALGSVEVSRSSGLSEPDDIARVGRLLAKLDREQRDVLLLFAWEDLSYQDIGRALGIPVGTVRSRLARARARLRSFLSDEPGLGTGAPEVSG
jgi:RNA polymerase sigma factor (sigma-70 family)